MCGLVWYVCMCVMYVCMYVLRACMYAILRYVPLPSATLHGTPCPYATLRYVMLRCATLRHVACASASRSLRLWRGDAFASQHRLFSLPSLPWRASTISRRSVAQVLAVDATKTALACRCSFVVDSMWQGPNNLVRLKNKQLSTRTCGTPFIFSHRLSITYDQ